MPCAFAVLSQGLNLVYGYAGLMSLAQVTFWGLGAYCTLTAAAYLMTQRIWIGDDSPDLAPTMAELDRRLRAIERWLAAGGRNRRETAATG